jgi:hypothetical protein
MDTVPGHITLTSGDGNTDVHCGICEEGLGGPDDALGKAEVLAFLDQHQHSDVLAVLDQHGPTQEVPQDEDDKDTHRVNTIVTHTLLGMTPYVLIEVTRCDPDTQEIHLDISRGGGCEDIEDVRGVVELAAHHLTIEAGHEPAQAVLREVLAERCRQDEKWGQQNHPDGTGPDAGHQWAVLAQIARDECQEAADRGESTWRGILCEEVCEAFAEADPAKLREELLQVAAVAAAWVEAIDRRAIPTAADLADTATPAAGA